MGRKLSGLEDIKFNNRIDAMSYLDFVSSYLLNMINDYGCFTVLDVKEIIEDHDFIPMEFEKKFVDMSVIFTDLDVFSIKRSRDGYYISLDFDAGKKEVEK